MKNNLNKLFGFQHFFSIIRKYSLSIKEYIRLKKILFWNIRSLKKKSTNIYNIYKINELQVFLVWDSTINECLAPHATSF